MCCWWVDGYVSARWVDKGVWVDLESVGWGILPFAPPHSDRAGSLRRSLGDAHVQFGLLDWDSGS